MGKAWRDIAFNAEIEPSGAKFVFVALGDLCPDQDAKGRKNDRCFPSRETLARMTGQSIRSVSRNLSRLEELGWIIAFERSRKFGGQTSNEYRLCKAPAGRQLSLMDTMADPADFAPIAETPPEIPAPDWQGGETNCPDRRDKMSLPPGQNVPPYKDNLTESLTGKEQGAPVRAIVSFEDFKKGYPSKGWKAEREDIVQAAWERASVQDRIKAVKSLPAYRDELERHTWRAAKAPENYLNQKIFEEFAQMAIVKKQIDSVVVDVGGPEFQAWAEYQEKQEGRPPFFVKYCEEKGIKTWPFRTPWPPGHPNGQQQEGMVF